MGANRERRRSGRKIIIAANCVRRLGGFDRFVRRLSARQELVALTSGGSKNAQKVGEDDDGEDARKKTGRKEPKTDLFPKAATTRR
jgi:hypothetical protein